MSSYDSNDVDVGYILKEIASHKGAILVSMGLIGALTYLGLSFVKPVYKAESRILIEYAENNFTKSAFNQTGVRNAISTSVVGSQVQILTSTNLAQKVIDELELMEVYQATSSKPLTEERVMHQFRKSVKVSHIPKTNVISVEASAYSPQLSALIANKLSNQFISWQERSKLDKTIGATSWLKEQIATLRSTVAKEESELEKFRSKHGILMGANNITLETQQLTAVNRQLVQAKVRSTEVKARRDAMIEIMRRNGSVNATREVLRSPFLQRLSTNRVRMEGRLSTLQASLLPSHPQIKRLNLELKSLNSRIERETRKIVTSLKNEAKIAMARENSLDKRLNFLKDLTGRNSLIQAQMKEMERDLKSNRTTLVGYMNRYQDVSGRRDNRALPTKATIISKAFMSSIPSFPKSKIAFAMIAAFAAGLLSLLYFGTKAVIGTPAPAPRNQAGYGHGRRKTDMPPNPARV